MRVHFFSLDGTNLATFCTPKSIKRALDESAYVVPVLSTSGYNVYFANALNKFVVADMDANKLLSRYSIENRSLPLRPRTEKGFTSFFVVLTNQCPLRCTYCFGAAGERITETARWPVIKAAIDYLAKFDEPIDMDFAGTGEQTLAFKLLKKTVEYARAKLNLIRIKLSTSGVMSRQKCRWVGENIDTIQVSFDGPPEIHDRQRPLCSGAGSSKYVVRTIGLLQEMDANYHVRAAITKPLLQNAEYVLRYFIDLGIEKSLFVRLKPIGRGERVDIPSPEEATKGLLKIIELKEEYGLPVKFDRERDVFDFFGICHPRGCNLGYNFCLALDGKLASCFMYTSEDDLRIMPGIDKLIFGYYDAKKRSFVIDEKLLSEHRNFLRNVACDSCSFKLCRGGCPYLNIKSCGNMLCPDSYLCEINIKTYRRTLRYLTHRKLIRLKPCIAYEGNKLTFALEYSSFKLSKCGVREALCSMPENPYIKISMPSDGAYLDKLFKEILSHHRANSKRMPLFLFSFNFTNVGTEIDLKRIEHFFAKLSGHGVYFRVSRPLQPFFREELKPEVKILEKLYRMPSSCYGCLELFTLHPDGMLRFCNGRECRIPDKLFTRADAYKVFVNGPKLRCWDAVLRLVT
jgi:uncharacterized protein